jgi:hypothetical protein
MTAPFCLRSLRATVKAFRVTFPWPEFPAATISLSHAGQKIVANVGFVPGKIISTTSSPPSLHGRLEDREQASQFVKVERLRQIMIEAGLLPEPVIRERFASGQRDRFQLRLKSLRFRNQIESIAIRQTQIAQEHIHPHVLQKLQRIRYSTRRDHLMIRAPEERGKHPARILMIFNDKDVHASIRSVSGRSFQKRIAPTAWMLHAHSSQTGIRGCCFRSESGERLVRTDGGNVTVA